MSTITENCPVIQKIMSNEELEDSDKLLAINELLNLDKRRVLLNYGDCDAIRDISWLFTWKDSELGHQFWKDIEEIVFNNEGLIIV